MARIAKSPEANRAAGNPGKRRLPETTPALTAPASGIAPPTWLRDQVAHDVWASTAPDLTAVRLLAPVDRGAFGRYCQHFADWVAATRALEAEGMTQDVPLTGGNGSMKRMHPLVRIRDNAEKRLVELEDRFGLNPAARYALVTKMIQRPGAFGGLFGDRAMQDEPAPQPDAALPPGEPSGPLAPQPQSPAPRGPLGFLRLN
ncbi:phage terminase, small subunit, putative, P27 family [Rhizobiales bacterium GAS188]|nr:phage terminase, small subunit, putative, P27 family [Rhizobiales bacterium GAS188]